ncbi:MAG: hypothetical protein ACJ8F7_06075 [Gemmataceae bacterium]
MNFRAIAAAAVLAAAALAPAARAEDKPTLLLRIKSIDGLLSDVKYLAKYAGHENDLEQVEPLARMYLAGIDTKRPITIYGDISAGGVDSPVVILLPISDEKEFLGTLENVGVKPAKGEDGVYTVDKVPNAPAEVTLYFRFAHKYAYITANDKGNIAEKKIPKPEQITLAAGDDTAVALDFRLDGVPDLIKQFAQGALDTQLSSVKDQAPANESKAAKELRIKVIDTFGERLKAVLNDGEELSLKFGLNQKKDDVTIDLSFKAKKGTPLAKDIETVGKSSRLFANLGRGAALQVALGATLPEDVRKALEPLVDNAIKEELEKEKDQAKAKAQKAILEALAPTVKAGDLDLGVALTGPDADGHFTGVFGIKVKDAKTVEEAFRQVLAGVPAKDREKVQLDSTTIGDVKVHKVLFDEKDEGAKKVFGTSGVYIAFRDDALLVTLGPDALKALKGAVELKAAAGPVANVTAAVGKLAGMDTGDKNAQKAAKEIFGNAPAGSDTIALTVEMGDSAKLKLTVKGKIVELIAKSQKGD